MNTNWRAIKTPEHWTALATEFITRSKQALKENDPRKLARCSDQLLRFLEKRTMACPAEVAEAVFHVQAELSQAVAARAIGSITERTAQVNAHLQDVQRVAQTLNEAAGRISLAKVKQTVDTVNQAVAELKRIKKQLQTASDEDAASSVAEVIDRLSAAINGLSADANQR